MTTFATSRLLLVDDEPEILADVAAYLRRRDLLVTTASSYEQADRIVNDPGQPFDILVTDVRMPDGSGIELARTFIRRSSGGPCILMTGHLELSELSADILKSGVIVVHKPFSVSALCAKVREVLAAAPLRGMPDARSTADLA